MTVAQTAARDVLNEYWDGFVPVDIRKIAESVGLTVQESSPERKSGYLNAEAKTIFVSPSESQVRQRFTVAHELGHFILGHGSSDRLNTEWSDRYTPEQMGKERDANQFAAEVLMPPLALSVLINKMGITDMVKLRKQLGVSSQSLYYRLKNLGYI